MYLVPSSGDALRLVESNADDMMRYAGEAGEAIGEYGDDLQNFVIELDNTMDAIGDVSDAAGGNLDEADLFLQIWVNEFRPNY